jgi:CCDC81-like prokaryotic HU domain 1/CCDC81-like prokaryotic HU domain 2/SPOR domain
MQLTDHIQHLLRDHDCVIIPDFGGLIADYEPARLHPVRHTLAPPAKRVAFNQALTRNDGLLVDAISRTLHLTPGMARQQVRDAVQRMQQELEEQQRTELPGIGVFRSLPGRGLDFEYTGHQNLLPASFGLPELTSRPVRATDALQARERVHQAPQPTLAPARRKALRRLANGVLGFSIVGLILSANLQFAQQMGYWPKEWWPGQDAATASAPAVARPQAASLAQPWTEDVVPDGTPEATPEISKPAPVARPAAVAPPKPAATPAAATASVAAATKAAVEGKTAATPPAKAATAGRGGNTVSGVSNRWYVVKATFNSMNGAAQVQKNYAAKGVAAKILLPRWGHRAVVNTKKYRVTVADFADKQSAQQSLPALKKQFGNEILVYPY